MSPICQSFVQNAWRKDLCSNCFKSKEEHSCSGKDIITDYKNSLTKRYVGVAGDRSTMYSRNYYGKNSWNPIMLDNSNNESRVLKSPGLIKGMDSIIKLENERNSYNDFCSESKMEKITPTTVTDSPLSKNIPTDSWIISKIIGDTREYNNNIKRNLEKKQGDSSSDLGSDSSHDLSGSSGDNSCLDIEVHDGESDCNSVISEPDSVQDDEPVTQSILKIPQHSTKLPKSHRGSISFKSGDDVIGYGGDVDYSDDDYSEDDDDDDASISSSDLTPEERVLKRVTEKNTNFNSENENLEKDPILEENETSLDSLLRSLSNEDTKQGVLVEISSLKQEGKVKLKRSPPIGGVKPQIKSIVSAPLTSSGLDLGYLKDVEEIPMKGIKPKYVSMDEEMRENTSYEEAYERVNMTSNDDLSGFKFTSIDDVAPKITSIDDFAPKITSIDDFAPKITSINDVAPKITSIDDFAPKITSIDNVAPKITSINDVAPKITSIDNVAPKITLIDNVAPKITLIDNTLSIPSEENKVSATRPLVEDTNSYIKPIPHSSEEKEFIVTRASNKDVLLPNSSEDLFKTNDPSTNFCNSVSDVCAVICDSKFTLCNSSEQKTPNSLCNVDNFTEKSDEFESIDCNLSDKTGIDLSVKSAQDNLFVVKYSNKNILKDNNENLKASNKKKLNDIVDSSGNLHKVRSAVVPLNYINIQRRNSFLESQLAGTVYTGGTFDTNLIQNEQTSHKGTKINCTKPTVPIAKILSNPSQSIVPPIKTNKTSKNCCKSFKLDSQQPDVAPAEVKHISDNANLGHGRNQENMISQANSSAGIEAKESSREYLSTSAIDSKSSRSCDNLVSSSEQILSKRCISSSSLSTFGTPMAPAQAPQSSFLHSGVVRPAKDTDEVNSVIYSTPDFLREIKNPLNEPPITAGIQKAALYTSTSCLKGLPSVKPATTPKPRIAVKPDVSSRIYQSPTPVTKTNSEDVFSSTSQIAPRSINGINTRDSTSALELSSCPNLVENKMHSDTNQALEIPQIRSERENNVYDVPVSLGSPTHASSAAVSAPSPTSSSSGYSTTSNTSQQEINESDHKREDELHLSRLDSLPKTVPAEGLTVSTVTTATTTIKPDDKVSDASQYKSQFEAKKNLLSANLCFNKDNQDFGLIQTGILKNNAFCSELERDPVCLLQTAGESEGNEKKGLISDQSNTLLNSANLQSYNMQNSYVNLQPPYENHDIDSYSSFTDDFDDDDDDDQITNRQFAVNSESDVNVLRRTERSSSSTPMFRNSVGPVNYPSVHSSSSEFGSTNFLDGCSKLPAVRSHSVPRAVESGVKSSLFVKSKTESSSKFGFGKAAGFFRPSSPPAASRKLSLERGRDREKKSNSVFSLRKLLRIVSHDKQKVSKEQKSMKDVERESQREARKLQLQIVHPLDYNTKGVEVIARPELRSPTYDVYGSSFQDFLQQQNSDSSQRVGVFENKETATNSLSHCQKVTRGEKFSKVVKKNSFLKKRRKNVEHKDSVKSETRSVITYVRRPSASSSNINAVSTSINDYAKCINISNVINTESSSVGHLNSQPSNVNLGYNSEGRPRPPPPPRKTSLETPNHEVFLVPINPLPLCSNSSLEALSPTTCQREVDSASLSSNSSLTSRPNRPPPPRRTPSAASSIKSGGCRPLATRDNVYANLGNARASFTPRKPGRSSSVRDEEKEKRRAPNPPNSQNDAINYRVMKGPAPPTPPSNDHDYEYITDASPDKTDSSHKEVRPIQSTLPSRHEKPNVAGVHSTNQISNLSLDDQYGAVVNANLEALSNMLDQICEITESHSDKKICKNIKQFADVNLLSTVPFSCGPRLFYSATYSHEQITVMVTPETKVEVDPLLMPSPILVLREDLPSHVLNRKLLDNKSKTFSSVWVLPALSICSLEKFANSLQNLLHEDPLEWEKRICFFLLQMVTALKQLQAKGIEEFSLDLFSVINNQDKNTNPRLLMSLPSTVGDFTSADHSYWSLCHCAAAATLLLLGHSKPLEVATKDPELAPPFAPSPHAYSTLVTTLKEERASSLTKAKCILEAILFGPVSLKLSSETNRDIKIQKWLDLERATVLHSLVREQSGKNGGCPSSLLTKFKLFFLVRTSVKALGEALKVLEAPDITNL